MKPSLCHSLAKRMEGLESGGADKQRQVGRHRNCLAPLTLFSTPPLYMFVEATSPRGVCAKPRLSRDLGAMIEKIAFSTLCVCQDKSPRGNAPSKSFLQAGVPDLCQLC